MPRNYRFAIGQLISHRRYGYRGVIVGCDRQCCATDEWYHGNRTQPDRERPWYHVLVHGAEHTTYVAEENLGEDGGGEQVIHPLTGVFFEHFSAGCYHPRRDVTFPGSEVPDLPAS